MCTPNIAAVVMVIMEKGSLVQMQGSMPIRLYGENTVIMLVQECIVYHHLPDLSRTICLSVPAGSNHSSPMIRPGMWRPLSIHKSVRKNFSPTTGRIFPKNHLIIPSVHSL